MATSKEQSMSLFDWLFQKAEQHQAEVPQQSQGPPDFSRSNQSKKIFTLVGGDF